MAVQVPPDCVRSTPASADAVVMYKPTTTQLPSAGQETLTSSAAGLAAAFAGSGALLAVQLPSFSTATSPCSWEPLSIHTPLATQLPTDAHATAMSSSPSAPDGAGASVACQLPPDWVSMSPVGRSPWP